MSPASVSWLVLHGMGDARRERDMRKMHAFALHGLHGLMSLQMHSSAKSRDASAPAELIEKIKCTYCPIIGLHDSNSTLPSFHAYVEN